MTHTATAVRTMVVWCCDWPVVAAGTPSDVAAAVFHANRVVACSPTARDREVQVGMRRRESQSRCPDLMVLDRDPAREARMFEPVVAAVEAFTPRIEITVPGSCAFCTRGPSRYFGGDTALAAGVADAVAEVLDGRGRCCVGAADGPFAATLAARGSVIVPEGESPAYLADFPLTALDRPDLADVLVRLGLTTLGAFAALPAADVVGRFGAEGQLAHRLASGLDERPPNTLTAPPDLQVSAELDPPAERVEQVAHLGRTLADQLHGRLADLGLACLRVAVEAETEHGERHERLWRHEGSLTAPAMADRIRWQLDGWLNGPVRSRPTGAVMRLSLVPDEVVAAKGRQLGFWGGETEAAERAARALTRVEAVVGTGAVTVAEWQGGRHPGDQFRLVPAGTVDLTGGRVVMAPRPDGDPLASRTRSTPADGPAPWPGRVPSPLPATVHPEPIPAEVIDGEGRPVTVDGRSMLSGSPARISIDGRAWADVAAWAGPWPADERWWDRERHRRRARFQVLTAAGAAYLLVLEHHQWWLDATYD